MTKQSEHGVSRKFLVQIESASTGHEVPVYATSLEEAEELAEAQYQEAGFMVTRIRPEVPAVV